MSKEKSEHTRNPESLVSPDPQMPSPEFEFDFLLVIPTYREHVRFPPFLRSLLHHLKTAPFTTHLAVIDDGSPSPEQEQLAHSICTFFKEETGHMGHVQLSAPELLPINTGKGNAILHAWRRQQQGHRWLAFVDADGAVPAAEVLRILSFIAADSDGKDAAKATACYVGTREGMPPRSVYRDPLRSVLGKIFSRLANVLLHTGVSDSQCGFKILSQIAFRKVETDLHGAGLCFDVELICAMRRAGLSVSELPIDWREMPGGSISVLRHGGRMLLQLWKLYRARKG